jgi:diguanylate cyclase
MVARVLRGAARDTDLVARIGGDEFALLLAETDEAGAGVVLARVRTSMAAAFLNEPGGVTVSVGAIVSTGHHPAIDTLLKEADSLLYKAKDQGKNCFVAAPRGTPPAA